MVHMYEDEVLARMRNLVEVRKRAHKVIKWEGGDFPLRNTIINLLRKVPLEKATLVEVFGGSGVVSQYAPRDRFPNIIYNDIDRRLTALYKLVKEDPELLFSLVSLLPYSREISEIFWEHREVGGVLGAVILFYLANTAFEGKLASPSFHVRPDPSHNSAREYMSYALAIFDVAKRFRDVVIECLDFRECIERYDSERTVFYCDPPFLSAKQDWYDHGFTHSDAAQLARMLSSIRGHYLLKLNESDAAYYEPRLRYTSKIVVPHPCSRKGKVVFFTSYRADGGGGSDITLFIC